MPLLDRRDGGRRLAQRLRALGGSDVVVLGLPAGGVPVAYEVATGLGAPLDLAVVGALTVPYQPWLVFGALGEGGVQVFDEDVIAHAFVGEPERRAVIREQRAKLRHNVIRYRREHTPLPLHEVTAVIVTDGLDTAATARAGVAIARARGAARVVAAAPVGSGPALRAVSPVVDALVCAEIPTLFGSTGTWYRDFDDVTEPEVCTLLDRAATSNPAPLLGRPASN
ncbi:phosphoribosyltransferase [Nocardia brasiliensis]|uniref:phosphoribosyltransferase n=1 Tax=Nocardia brasiliensis TaxID=37326 RepID=UPI00366EC644